MEPITSSTSTRGVAFHEMTDQALHRRVPAGLIPVFRYCLDRAASPLTADAVGRTVGLSAKALGGAERARTPPVATIVSWSQALAAAYRLEHSAEPATLIARSLGFCEHPEPDVGAQAVLQRDADELAGTGRVRMGVAVLRALLGESPAGEGVAGGRAPARPRSDVQVADELRVLSR